MNFADIILPLSIKGTFTYVISDALYESIKPGMRVEIEFGKKIYAGIVNKIHNEKPNFKNIKPILSLIDQSPILTENHLKFWSWMADYYMCSLGEIMVASLPSFLKLSSETIYIFNPYCEVDIHKLSDEAYLIFEAIQQNDFLKNADIEIIIQNNKIHKYINELIQWKAIIVQEFLKDNYKSKIESSIDWYNENEVNEKLEEYFLLVKKAPAQEKLLLEFLHLKQSEKKILTKKLLETSSRNVLNELIKKKILSENKNPVDRISFEEKENKKLILNKEQKNISEEITKSDKNIHCLYGITGSGKTFVYLDLIKKCIENKKQVLYLIPEIALTTQLIQHLLSYLGNNIGIYHSKFSDNERVEIYNKVKNNELKIVIGVRSALFLPFTELGLIIIDEEHDKTYKQQDPAPRYQARDSAIVLAHFHNSKVVLGSATPSLETLYNVGLKKYVFHSLTHRFENADLPQVELIDITKEQKDYRYKELFSQKLLQEIQTNLKNGKQSIIFQNRRGYAPFIMCANCGSTPTCTQCDVSLTYHKQPDKLICHYCNLQFEPSQTCVACGSSSVKAMSFGTEKIEENLLQIFPHARIQRFDQDSTRKKNAHHQIIEAFEMGKIDILIGTQMLVKGLHFENVQLVGIINADSLISYPDFRAAENALQMFEQVSGRAGRKYKDSKVIVQSYKHSSPVLQSLVLHDYLGFAKEEMKLRKEFLFPPYCRLISVIFKNKNEVLADECAQLFYHLSHKVPNAIIKEPSKPLISKIKNVYIREITIKLPLKNEYINQIKQVLNIAKDRCLEQKKYKSTYIYFDVDPY